MPVWKTTPEVRLPVPRGTVYPLYFQVKTRYTKSMKIKNETTVSNALRHLTDAELTTAGWTAGQIAELRKYVAKGATNVHQRRLLQRYQSLRRTVVAAEAEAAAKAAKRAERYVSTVYTLTELDQIPDLEARVRALKLVALWDFTDGASVSAFPGVFADEDLHDPARKINYYLRGADFPVDTPPMFSTAARLTQRVEKVFPERAPHQTYRYFTVTLRTALTRAMQGQDLFAWGEVR